MFRMWHEGTEVIPRVKLGLVEVGLGNSKVGLVSVMTR